MVRPQHAAVVVLILALGGPAQARRLICEAEPLTSPADPPADPSLRLDEERPVAPAPLRDVCRPGTVDDPSCWSELPLPARGPDFSFAWNGWSAVPTGTASPRRPVARASSGRTDVTPLSDGFARRIERPPR